MNVVVEHWWNGADHKRNLVGGAGGGSNAPNMFSTYDSPFCYGVEERQIKKVGVRVEGKGCMYIKYWLKPVFPLF